MNPEELAVLITQQTGKKVSGWAPCHLLNDELVALSAVGPNADEWYFGDFVIHSTESYLPSAIARNIGALVGDVDTLAVSNNLGQPIVNSSIHRGVLWNKIADWNFLSGHFYGYKFTRQREYVVQSKTMQTAVGWSNVGTVYTHSSGTLELAASGAWAVSSQLRITITVTGMTSGQLTIEFDSGTVGTITSNGTYTYTFNTGALDSALYLTPTGIFDGSIDTDTLIIEKYT